MSSALDALLSVIDGELKRQSVPGSCDGCTLASDCPPDAADTAPYLVDSSGTKKRVNRVRARAAASALQASLKVAAPYCSRSSPASSGTVCVSGHSEMSDQEQLNSEHLGDLNHFFLLDEPRQSSYHPETLATSRATSRNLSAGMPSLDVAPGGHSLRPLANGASLATMPHMQSRPSASAQAAFTNGTASLADASQAPLPLFQAQWPRTSDASAASGSQTVLAAAHIDTAPTSKRTADQLEPAEAPSRKAPRLTGFAARMSGTSTFRGVSWHTQTSRWKAQIKVAGKDVNLGRHRDEVEAARAYDRAAICARGTKDAKLNFAISDYAAEIDNLTTTPLVELAASLRGVEQRLQAQTSRYHGVRLNKRTQKWEAYIRVAGKHVHLGCYDAEVAAAQAFDQAALVRQAHNLGAMGGKPQLVTNFPPMIYLEFTNQLFQLANPLMNGAKVEFNKSTRQGAYCRLEDKYVQNLLQKCREQGGSLTAYPSIVS